MSRRKKLINNTDIPQHQIEVIARCILPDILAFYESEEGQREFSEWKKQREMETQKAKQNKGIAKAGVIRKWWHPAFFAFIWISSFSVALLAWRSVCASPRCGNRWFRNGQRK